MISIEPHEILQQKSPVIQPKIETPYCGIGLFLPLYRMSLWSADKVSMIHFRIKQSRASQKVSLSKKGREAVLLPQMFH